MTHAKIQVCWTFYPAHIYLTIYMQKHNSTCFSQSKCVAIIQLNGFFYNFRYHFNLSTNHLSDKMKKINGSNLTKPTRRGPNEDCTTRVLCLNAPPHTPTTPIVNNPVKWSIESDKKDKWSIESVLYTISCITHLVTKWTGKENGNYKFFVVGKSPKHRVNGSRSVWFSRSSVIIWGTGSTNVYI